MSFNIRNAEKKDMPQVLELITELAIFENEPNAVEVTVTDLINEIDKQNPLFTCFVAEKEEEILGIALVYFRFSTWKGKTVHLEDLIVKKQLRGTGIGKALYTKVLRFANQEKVRRVEWAVLNWNTNAIQFYEKSGARVLKDWYLVQMDETGLNAFVKNNTA